MTRPNIKKELTLVKNLFYAYAAIGCLVAAVLGFLSFGTMGLLAGFSLTALTSIMLKKKLQLIKAD